MDTLNSSMFQDVSTTDRLSFTLFLAISLHGAIILGVTFTSGLSKSSMHTLEITLVQNQSNDRPDKAEFLAQFNQAGSGTLTEKRMITTLDQSQDLDSRNDDSAQGHKPVNRLVEQAQQPVITSRKNTASDNTRTVLTRPVIKDDTSDGRSLPEYNLEVASLEARLDRQRQIHAKLPRIKRLTSQSTAASQDALYLDAWRRKIETVGNLNYPEEARRQQIYGSLRLMVAILPDGRLMSIKILKSSGHQILDNAAVNIVTIASPFMPFPEEISQTTDMIEIIRTWQFRQGGVHSY